MQIFHLWKNVFSFFTFDPSINQVEIVFEEIEEVNAQIMVRLFLFIFTFLFLFLYLSLGLFLIFTFIFFEDLIGDG